MVMWQKRKAGKHTDGFCVLFFVFLCCTFYCLLSQRLSVSSDITLFLTHSNSIFFRFQPVPFNTFPLASFLPFSDSFPVYSLPLRYKSGGGRKLNHQNRLCNWHQSKQNRNQNRYCQKSTSKPKSNSKSSKLKLKLESKSSNSKLKEKVKSSKLKSKLKLESKSSNLKSKEKVKSSKSKLKLESSNSKLNLKLQSNLKSRSK